MTQIRLVTRTNALTVLVSVELNELNGECLGFFKGEGSLWMDLSVSKCSTLYIVHF